MALLLPEFFVLTSRSVRSTYLTLPENPHPNHPSGFLMFQEPSISSPRAKFAMEPSERDGTLVHIRSCFNNKYWVVQSENTYVSGQVRHWIVATADKPEEDQTNPACTLFRPRPNTNSGFTLASIAGNMRAFVTGTGSYGEFSTGILMARGNATEIAAIETEPLLNLPSQVTFRSQQLNRKYLCSRSSNSEGGDLSFESGLNATEPEVAHQLFLTNDGNYRIKSVTHDKFWRRNPVDNRILADTDDNNNSRDALFSIVKISDKVIAIRNLGNNNFCGPQPLGALSATFLTMSTLTKFIVEEPPVERKILSISYRLSEARIYHEEIQEVSHAIAKNDSSDKATTVTLTYSSSESRTTRFTNSMSVDVGTEVTFKNWIIPVITRGEVKLSAEVGHDQRKWGVEETTEVRREASYTVVVPPMTTLKVTLMATKAACDVSFSYRQRDLLASGEWVSSVRDDGVFTGINSYNYYFESSEVDQDAQGRILVI